MMSHTAARRGASTVEFEGLIRVVGLFARHPDFPGKRDAVEECAEDIEERSREGRLTPSQRSELLAILRSGPEAQVLPWQGRKI